MSGVVQFFAEFSRDPNERVRVLRTMQIETVLWIPPFLTIWTPNGLPPGGSERVKSVIIPVPISLTSLTAGRRWPVESHAKFRDIITYNIMVKAGTFNFHISSPRKATLGHDQSAFHVNIGPNLVAKQSY